VLSKIPCVDDAYAQPGSRAMGFSKDGRYLGFCISSCDACPTSCRFDDAVTKRAVILDGYSSLGDPLLQAGKITEEEAQRRGEAQDAKRDAFLADHGVAKVTAQRVLHGPWPYDDLVLETRESRDRARGTVTVEVGASVVGSSAPPVFPIRIELGPHPGFRMPMPKDEVPKDASPGDRKKALAAWRDQWMLDAIAAVVDVTPDGKDLGVVAFAHGAMWFEDARVARMPVASFAAKVRARRSGVV
jgi:hypothetical protein